MTNFVLEILDGEQVGETRPLAAGKLTIGRRAGNDLILKDEKVSGAHAEIVFEDGGYLLRDLQSTNGTMMDGKRITEVVLTPGDVFVVGRVRVAFRAEGAVAASDELTMRHLDAAALARAGRRRGVGLMLGLLVLLAGGAGWFLLRDGGPSGSSPRGQQRRAPREIPGNRLPAELAQAETQDPWEPVAGAGFAADTPGSSGSFALTATRAEGEAAGFALARSGAALPVRSGERLALAAMVRTEGSARAGVRLALSSSQQEGRVPLVSGTQLIAAEDWAEVQAQLDVPPGFDRLRVEVVALLPDAQARAQVDDIAVTDAGGAARSDLSVAGRALAVTGASFALWGAADPILAQSRPVVAEGPFAPLAAAGLAVPSDLGHALEITPTEEGFTLKQSGGQPAPLGFELQFAAGFATGGVATRTDGKAFTQRGEEFDAAGVTAALLGTGNERISLAPATPARVTARTRNRQFWLRIGDASAPCTELTLRVVFGAERSSARELLRSARTAAKPADALAHLRALLTELPHDDDTQREAQALRAQVLEGFRTRLDGLRAELETVRFFQSLVGWRRLKQQLDTLLADYGTADLPDPDAIAAMQTEITEQLSKIAADARAAQHEQLQGLVALLDKAGQERLAQLVRRSLEAR